MLISTETTRARLGDFYDFAASLAPHPIAVLSYDDIWGFYPHSKAGVDAVDEVMRGFGNDYVAVLREHMEPIKQSLLGRGYHGLRIKGQGKDEIYGVIIMGRPAPTIKKALLNLVPSIKAYENFRPLSHTPKQIEHIFLLHELYHAGHGVPHLQKKTTSETFAEELAADRYATRQALRLPGHTDAVADFITARQVAVAHGTNHIHMTGYALIKGARDAPSCYEAIRGFSDKLETVGNSRNLDEGYEKVEAMLGQNRLSPVEIDIAKNFLAACEQWSVPARGRDKKTVMLPVRQASVAALG